MWMVLWWLKAIREVDSWRMTVCPTGEVVVLSNLLMSARFHVPELHEQVHGLMQQGAAVAVCSTSQSTRVLWNLQN